MARNAAKLKKELDTVYSIYIRLTYADLDGYVKCFTCGSRFHWKKIQNGHYISRTHLATRWLDKNCHPQCIGCNIFKHGNMDEYAVALVKKYGAKILMTLNALKHKTTKISLDDYEKLIKKYKKKNKQLEDKINNPFKLKRLAS